MSAKPDITDAMRKAGLSVLWQYGVENISADWGERLSELIYVAMRTKASSSKPRAKDKSK